MQLPFDSLRSLALLEQFRNLEPQRFRDALESGDADVAMTSVGCAYFGAILHGSGVEDAIYILRILCV